MRICIMTVGSRGDVAPFIGLGLRLREAGHEVTVATQESFELEITSFGLRFRSLPGNTQQVMDSAEGRRWTRAGNGLRAARTANKVFRQFFVDLADPVIEAAQDADVLLLQATPATHGYLVARAWGIPAVLLNLTPGLPTEEFLPAMLGNRSLGRRGNRLINRVAPLALRQYDPLVIELQRRLGLPETGFVATRREMFLTDVGLPILEGYSPLISPRPADWRAGVEIVGYWWAPRPPDWTPPTELVDFLASGPPPLFVGLGSHGRTHRAEVAEAVVAAARSAGLRTVIQSGWADLQASGDDVITIGEVPHDWLFPQMAALVHHAGAGTTGAGLRAGVPAVGVPVLADQPFWAARLAQLGVSPGSVPLKRLTADRLAPLLRAAVAESYRKRAAEVAERVGAEDGAGRVVEKVAELAESTRAHNI